MKLPGPEAFDDVPNLGRADTLYTFQINTGVKTPVACPTGKKLAVWFTWVSSDGGSYDRDTHCLLKFGSRTVAKLSSEGLGNSTNGWIGPIVGEVDEALKIENEAGDAGTSMALTVTAIPVG